MKCNPSFALGFRNDSDHIITSANMKMYHIGRILGVLLPILGVVIVLESVVIGIIYGVLLLAFSYWCYKTHIPDEFKPQNYGR